MRGDVKEFDPTNITKEDARVSKARLLKLAKYLDSVPDDKFDYNKYATSVNLRECGSLGCALGHATSIPEFRDLGLHLKKWPYGYRVVCGAASDASAGMVPFRLTCAQAHFLFLPNYFYGGDRAPDERASAKDVARHIRSFVKKYRADDGVYHAAGDKESSCS
jgi:hypothetical protein